MKTNLKSIAFASLFFFGSATLFAQGGADRTPGNFTKIATTGSSVVQLAQGETMGVHIEGPAELVEKVKTELKDDVLHINSGDAGSKVKIIVTAPVYNSIDATGASTVKSQGKLTPANIRITSSGASDIELDLETGTIDANAVGASDIKLTGKAQTLNAEISGASDLKAYGLEADNAKLNVSGTSDANVNVKTSIEANASGSSDVRYIGTPVNKTINRSGSADVRQKDASDTTRVGMGGKQYTIISDNNDDDDDDRDFNPGSKGNFHFWQGIDIHMNAILDSKNSIDPIAGYEFMELNYPRSIGVSWNMLQKNIHIYKNYVNLATGFGIDWTMYGFRNNVTLRNDTNYLAVTTDTVDYRRNRLRAFYVQVPLMLEFSTSENEDRAFHIGAGVLLGYNVFDNKLKQKYELDGKDYKNVVRDDFNINPVRYGLTARVGYGDYSIFANYNLSTLFEKDAAPKMYPVQVGFHMNL